MTAYRLPHSSCSLFTSGTRHGQHPERDHDRLDHGKVQLVAHYLLSAEADFSAAHRLPGVDRCDRLHGHNWRIRLTVRVSESAVGEDGMAVDFRDIEQIARSVVEDFDHAYLNDLEPFRNGPPTAERLAKVVCERATARLSQAAPAARVEQVEAWETPHYRIVFRPV